MADLSNLVSSRVARRSASYLLAAGLWLDPGTYSDRRLFRCGRRIQYHGFRALAERSILADVVKDSAVATQVPRLAPRWQNEVEAQLGWDHFGVSDLMRLKSRFGVDWVIVERPGIEGLHCPYQNATLLVCHLQ